MVKGKNSLLKGTTWTTVSFIIVTLVYLFRISILTRFLDKTDFGLVAIVLFVVGFTNIFADLGVSTAILSKKDISKKEYSSLYWSGLFLAVALYIIVIFCSPLFAYFYNEEMLQVLIPIMGIDLIISTFGRQFSVFKQRDLKFKQLAIIKILSEISSLLVALVLAFYGLGIWSLVISLLTSSLINSVLNIILGYKEHPIIFYLNFKETKPLYKIGLYQTGAQVLDYISSQIDVLILGKILPMSEMGVYSIVKTLVLRVYVSLNQIISKVAVPIFAKLNYTNAEFKKKYLDIIYVVAVVNIVSFLILFLQAENVLNILYGDKYLYYTNILQVLCLWGLFSSVINCAAVIIVISTGRTDLGFKWTQYRLVLNPLFIFLGAYYGGILGVAISQAFYSFFTMFLYNRVVIKKIIKGFLDQELLKCFLKPLVIAIFLGIVVIFLKRFFKLQINIFIELIGVSLLVISVYAGLFGRVLKQKVKSI